MSDAAQGPFAERDAVSPEEYAHLTGLSLSTVRRYVRDQRLPSVQPGGRRCRVLIPRTALVHVSPTDQGLGAQAASASTLPVQQAPSRGSKLPGPAPHWRQSK